MTAVLTVLIAILLAELTVRLADPARLTPPLIVGSDRYNHGLRAGAAIRSRVAPERYPVELRVNAQGLAQATDVIVPKPANVYRVIVMGDSFIQGFGAGKSLPEIVDSALAPWHTADGRRVEVINGGVQSYSPLLHHARYVNQFTTFAPDAVIVFPDLTDVYDDHVRYRSLAHYEDGELVRVRRSKPLAVLEQTRERFLYDAVPVQSYRYLVAAMAEVLAGRESRAESELEIFSHALEDGGHPSPAALEAIRFTTENVRSLVARLRADGVHVAIMIYPHLGQLVHKDDITAVRPLNRLFEHSLLRLGADQRVPVVSYLDAMKRELAKGDPLYFRGDMHFNPDGLRALSARVTESLVESGQELLGTNLVRAEAGTTRVNAIMKEQR